MENKIVSRKYVLLAVFFVLIDLLSRLPYFNLFLTALNMFIILWAFSIYAFKIDHRYNYVIALLFVIWGAFSVLIKRDASAEYVFNIVYFLIVLGFIQNAILIYRKSKQQK